MLLDHLKLGFLTPLDALISGNKLLLLQFFGVLDGGHPRLNLVLLLDGQVLEHFVLDPSFLDYSLQCCHLLPL